jgi:hypothetical protein
MDSDRCYSYFHAMWYAYLKGDTALVNRFYEPIMKFDRHSCPVSLIFVKSSFLMVARPARVGGEQYSLPSPLTPIALRALCQSPKGWSRFSRSHILSLAAVDVPSFKLLP